MRLSPSSYLVLPLCMTLIAQQQEAPLVKFESTTQLVVEAVSVKDKNGKVIENLTAKDFVLTENGVPQAIRFCEFQKLEEAPAGPLPAPTVTTADIATPKASPITQIAPEPPGDIRYKD